VPGRLWRFAYAIELGVAGLGGAALSASLVEDDLDLILDHEAHLVLDEHVKSLDDQLQNFLHSARHLDVDSLVDVLKVLLNGRVPALLLEERVVEAEGDRVT
jgi:hypothetical protein